MQHTNKTAGETAPRKLVIIRDCHAKNNIVVTVNSDREEERIRLRAMSQNWLVAVRKPKELGQILDKSWTSTKERAWRKPSALASRPHSQLAGAFRLALTALAKEGGEA